MKQIITEKDIVNLKGKFVVQLNNTHDEPDMTDNFRANPGFWLEKRISFIGVLYGVDGIPHIEPKEQLVIMNGLYYTHGIYTNEEFIFCWNHYLPGKSKNERYHRLLTNKELGWLLGELKQ